jgi:hypothetical protein
MSVRAPPEDGAVTLVRENGKMLADRNTRLQGELGGAPGLRFYTRIKTCVTRFAW